METTTEGSLLLEAILYSTSSTTSSPAAVISEIDDEPTSTLASLAAAAASSTSSEEISSTATTSLLEDDGESFLFSNITSTISSLTSLEDDDDSNEMFADKIAGDYDVTTPLRVPKYFQAIITLFVCATLLICTIGIIKQVRLLCHKSSCHAAKIPLIRVSSARDGSDDDGLDSVLVENGKSKKDNRSEEQATPGGRHFDYYTSNTQQGKDHSTLTNGDKNGTNGGDSEDLLKLKKVRFVRRVSGPFSDEAMDFAGATYKMDPKDAPYLSKEKSKSSKKIEPKIKFGSIRKQSQPTIPPSSLPQTAPPPPRPPPRSSSPPPPPPPRSSPPPL